MKDTTRFDDPGGWVYMNYGEERPWAPAAKPFPPEACNACHETSGADDWVFTQFYPVLRDNDPKLKAAPLKAEDVEVEKKAILEHLEAVPSPVPVEADALFAFLQEGGYKSFATQDAEPHPSAGPH